MNREEARLFLGDGEALPDRTFARLVTDEGGKRGWQVRREKKGKIVIYDDDDLARLKDDLKAEKSLALAKPANALAAAGSHPIVKRPAKGQGIEAALIQLLASQPTRQASDKVAIKDKLALTPREASEISGLSLAKLKRDRRAGKFATIADGNGWRVARAELERYVTAEQGREGELS